MPQAARDQLLAEAGRQTPFHTVCLRLDIADETQAGRAQRGTHGVVGLPCPVSLACCAEPCAQAAVSHWPEQSLHGVSQTQQAVLAGPAGPGCSAPATKLPVECGGADGGLMFEPALQVAASLEEVATAVGTEVAVGSYPVRECVAGGLSGWLALAGWPAGCACTLPRQPQHGPASFHARWGHSWLAACGPLGCMRASSAGGEEAASRCMAAIEGELPF